MFKIKKISAALVFMGMSALSLPSLSAELIQNGGFESYGANVYSITSWGVAEEGILGSVLVENDTVTDASGRNTVGVASGSYYGLLDSASISNQALYQSFSTVAASSAILTFQMFVNNQSANGTQINTSGLDYTTGGSYDPNQHVRVDVLNSGASVFSINSTDVAQNLYLGGSNGNSFIGGDVANPYVTYSFDLSSLLSVGGTYTLRFASVTNENQLQLGIDNVSLSVTAVPEPETYAMLLSGLGLMGFMARRRSQT
jgi:PEP-CTERM motif